MGWLGFWVFVSVLAVCDTWLFSKGYESFLWKRRTDAEKQLQQIQIDRAMKGDSQ